LNDDHHCAQNRDNHLVTAKIIANKYEHFILANPTWKIESIKSTVLQDFFADVSTSKCKAAIFFCHGQVAVLNERRIQQII
jgi:alpha-galactosidase